MKKRVLSILSAAILAVTASIPVNVSALKQEEIATGRLSEYVKRFGDNAVVVFYSESENNGNAELIITEDYEAYNLTERKRGAVVTFEKDSTAPIEEINEKIAPYKLNQTEETNKYLIPTLPDIYEVLKTYDCVQSIDVKYVITICPNHLWTAKGIFIRPSESDFSIEKTIETYSELGLAYDRNSLEQEENIGYYFTIAQGYTYENLYHGFKKMQDDKIDYTFNSITASLANDDTISNGYENIYTKGKENNTELNTIRNDISQFISENKLKADVVLEDKYGLNDLKIIIEVQPDLMIAGYIPEIKTKLEDYIINNYSQEYTENLVFAPTDLLEAHEKVKNYITENNLNEKGIVCVDFEKYPDEFGRVVVETYDNYDHEAWLSVIEYIQNNINENNLYYLCRIVIQDDIIMTTANPNAEKNSIKGDAIGIIGDRTSEEYKEFFNGAILIENDYGFSDVFSGGKKIDNVWAKYETYPYEPEITSFSIYLESYQKGNCFDVAIPHAKDDEVLIKSVLKTINSAADITRRDYGELDNVVYTITDDKFSEESIADAKKLCKELKSKGLVSTFTYSGNMSTFIWTKAQLDEFTYYKSSLEEEDITKISDYLKNQNVDFKLEEDSYVSGTVTSFVFDQKLTTQSEHEERMRLLMDIYEMGYTTVDFYTLESVMNLNRESYTIYDNSLLGDVNGTGTIDISDAILAKCYILNSDKYPIAEEQMLYGDVIGNNGINQQDALAIQQYAVGLIDTF